MRIAFVCFEAFHHGGIRTYARELLNGIVEAGHRVVLFSPPAPGPSTGLSAAVQLQEVKVVDAPLTSAPTYWWNIPRVFRRTVSSSGRFDIVHSTAYADFLLTRKAAAGVRIVTVHHLGGTAAASLGLRLSS